MLLELHIKDIAIIEDLHITFGPGLNILTGETGAGKSIIIDAVKLLLGDRATSDIIRGSSEEATVEALFEGSSLKAIAGFMERAGFPMEDTLLIKRTFSRTGKNRVFLNGSMATLGVLVEVGKGLIDIYGQHDYQSLIRAVEHIDYLDAFGGLMNLRDEVGGLYRELLALEGELNTLMASAKELAERQGFLTFQSKEIETAGLKVGEDEGLKRERDRLVHAERLFSLTATGHEFIYSSPGSVIERIGKVISGLKEALKFDETLLSTVETLQSLIYQLEDVANTLRDYSQGLNLDPGRLEEVEERLALIGRLKKKYGATIQEILEKKAMIDKELDGITQRDERIEGLKERVDVLRRKALNLAEGLSRKREEAGIRLKKRVEEELATLGMKGSLFEVRIEGIVAKDGGPRLTEKGVDRVEFYISPNVGEEPRPMAKIASGGELSRIMLALKGIIAGSYGVPTLIFDEVDSGIGGGVAEVVGRRLKDVSGGHQVLCITHLPQIAVYADTHYLVSKEVKGGRTSVGIREVEGEERVMEVSRMLGGMKITDKTREHAREMLENAKCSHK